MDYNILDNVRTVEYDGDPSKGTLSVRLEIPKTSTLHEEDIRMIIALSSWDMNPNNSWMMYEGGRALVVEKHDPVQRGALSLKGLEISGIGYREIKNHEHVGAISNNDPFLQPCADNFMRYMRGTQMSATHFKDGKRVDEKPEYKALGTYTFPQLRTKVRKTDRASRFDLRRMAVPSVEAYGYYLDDRLKDADGPFGFIVTPIPLDRRRFAEEVSDYLLGNANLMDVRAFAYQAFQTLSSGIIQLSEGLRELHDKERVTHHETHISNFYATSVPYLVDWSTMRSMTNKKEDNIRNRAVDLTLPVLNLKSMMRTFAPLPELIYGMMEINGYEMMIEMYKGVTDKEFSLVPWVEKSTKKKLDFEFVVEALKDLGFEGFPRRYKDGNPVSVMDVLAAQRSMQERERVLRGL